MDLGTAVVVGAAILTAPRWAALAHKFSDRFNRQFDRQLDRIARTFEDARDEFSDRPRVRVREDEEPNGLARP